MIHHLQVCIAVKTFVIIGELPEISSKVIPFHYPQGSYNKNEIMGFADLLCYEEN